MSEPFPLTVRRPLDAKPRQRGSETAAQRRAVKELVSALTSGLFEPRRREAGVPAEQRPQSISRPHPGLAPWQIRQLRQHLDSNIGSKITTQTLASIARLSPSHFSRAFSVSFGDSPHRYLLQRRMERSQDLMLSTDAAIADIALDCGLVDQAHFGRLFRRLVGESPAAWRRARMGLGSASESRHGHSISGGCPAAGQRGGCSAME
jgi:AraC-like DNA-binding protein